MSRIGKTVLYTLSESDVKEIIERRRLVGAAIAKGNTPAAGQEVPAIITADWGGSVNLRVILDGHDDHWATSRPQWTEDRVKIIYRATDPDDGATYVVRAERVHQIKDGKLDGDDVVEERVPTHEFTWREIAA